MTMRCPERTRSFVMWAAIAIAITAASMSSSHPRKAQASPDRAEQVAPRVSLTLPLN